MQNKKERKRFGVWEHKKEEEYLRQQHNAGWKLVKTNIFAWFYFEECEPEDVVYQLDYNNELSDGKENYIKMFADCGWEYVQDCMGYHYFRKPAAKMNGEEEIFSDNTSRIAMMQRVLKGRLLPLLVILLCVFLPQFYNSLSDESYLRAAVLGLCMLLYIVIFVLFAIRYYRLKKA